MMHLFNMRQQQEQEHLNDFVKRFKQSCDVLRSHMGSKWLDGFVEHRNIKMRLRERTIKSKGTRL